MQYPYQSQSGGSYQGQQNEPTLPHQENWRNNEGYIPPAHIRNRDRSDQYDSGRSGGSSRYQGQPGEWGNDESNWGGQRSGSYGGNWSPAQQTRGSQQYGQSQYGQSPSRYSDESASQRGYWPGDREPGNRMGMQQWAWQDEQPRYQGQGGEYGPSQYRSGSGQYGSGQGDYGSRNPYRDQSDWGQQQYNASRNPSWGGYSSGPFGAGQQRSSERPYSSYEGSQAGYGGGGYGSQGSRNQYGSGGGGYAEDFGPNMRSRTGMAAPYQSNSPYASSGMSGSGTMSSRRKNGPKNYTRSDERIREDINDRLMQIDEIDVSDIEVSVSSGEVTLSGTVGSRHCRYALEEVADSVPGVKDVTNNIRIKRDHDIETKSGSGSSTGSSYATSGSRSSGTSSERSSTTAGSTSSSNK